MLSEFEKLTLVVQSAQAIAIVVGFVFAAAQIRNARFEIEALKESHRQNHDFQRRAAAQAAMSDFNYSSLSAELIGIFKYTDNNTPIELAEIERSFAAHEQARAKLIMLFRHYEGLARGVNHGVYDEAVVKSALKSTLIRFSKIFKHYIDERRLKLNRRLWIEFTNLADKWLAEDTANEQREGTGTLR